MTRLTVYYATAMLRLSAAERPSSSRRSWYQAGIKLTAFARAIGKSCSICKRAGAQELYRPFHLSRLDRTCHFVSELSWRALAYPLQNKPNKSSFVF